MLSAPGPDGRPAIAAQDVADFWVAQGQRIFHQKGTPAWITSLRNIWRPKYKVSTVLFYSKQGTYSPVEGSYSAVM